MNFSRVKQRLQAALKLKGYGLLGLSNSFKEFDTNGNGELSWEEFNAALVSCGLTPSPQDVRALFLEFDTDGSNSIDYDEFILAMRGEISPKRRDIITRTFESIDIDKDGVISMTDIGASFNPKNHPDVKAGKISVADLLMKFFDTFTTVSSSGLITLPQFIEYYANIAAHDDDSTFEATMASLWNSLRPTGGQSATRSLQAFVTSKAPTETNSTSIPALDQLRTQLAARGARGIVGLQRTFRIMDDDGSKSFNLAEFKKGVKQCNITISDTQLNQLFRFFDKDRSGTIDFDEFIQAVRGQLNPRRKNLVDLALAKLDLNGDGLISPEELVGRYDASKHPEVIQGKKSPDEVLREFLETFDIGGEVDGKVTQSEFENYYANISASIDDDDYFELMIRNAWHISGGESWSANSANRRVLVTGPDGSQYVEEIKEDLGLKADDKAGMMGRLKAQGVNATSLDLFGGADNTTAAKKSRAGGVATRFASGVSAGPNIASKDQKMDSLSSKLSSMGIGLGAVGAGGAGGLAAAVAVPSQAVSVALAGPSAPSSTPRDASSASGSGFIPKKASNEIPNAGVGYIIKKLKAQLKSRGSSGFHGLQRKFRSMTPDSSRSMAMGDFKVAMKEMEMGLSDAELRMLFDYFDTDHSASVDFEEFIQGVRDPLDERRLRLVQMAFSKLDKDGSGIVDAQEIAKAYDASKHPEVIAGRMTPAEVFAHFLDTFDVGGVHDGHVTLPEFINYYTNLGANIDNDDYFELMIRNAWHISGGESWSANSANRRVLVTMADGTESVVEIQDDLGLRAGDKAGMMSRLKTQGFNASSISLSDSIDNTTAATRARPATAPSKSLSASVSAKGMGAGNRPVAGGVGSGMNFTTAAAAGMSSNPPDLAVAQAGPRLRGAQLQATASSIRPSTAPSSAAATAGAAASGAVSSALSKVADYGLQMIIKKFKNEMKSRGSNGFIGLQRKFRIMDDDDSKTLNLAEFKKAMKEMNIPLSDAELRMLFDYFDTDHNASVDFEEFIQGMRDPLDERRLRLVQMAFAKLDKDGSGIVDAQEIAKAYDASKHPEVMAGRMTPAEVFAHFLDTFDVGGVHDGHVTLPEFINYYTNLGASIDSDDYFELMIRNAWHISGGEGWSANSANRRVLVTRPDGSQYVEEIKEDLGLKADDKAGMMGRLKAQGVTASSISLTDSVVDDAVRDGLKISQGGLRRFSSLLGRSTVPAGVLPGTQSSVKQTVPRGKTRAPPQVGEPHAGLQPIVAKLKNELATRGARGFVGLQRKFRIMDDDGSKSLTMAEFKKAMKEMNMGLGESELRMLFDHFDADHSSTINFEEFIQGVRDSLDERRLALVKDAFKRIDRDGSGLVDAQEIAGIYDASKHPEVLAGRMTPEQVFREFLDTFDVGGIYDGKVTEQEFVNYYTNLGASVDSDDYFELMIRNAWHISGGAGWSANSANRRVLATKADGSQSVVEIKEDLGLKANDKAGMINRLKTQGFNASSIELFGGLDDTTPASRSKPSNLGQLAKAKSRDPAAISSIAGAQTASKETVKSTIQPSGPATPLGGRRKAQDKEADYGLQLIIKKLKDELKKHGASGFVGLQRKFRIVDDDGSHAINVAEFKKAMKELNIALNDAELRMLFEYFDKDKSGSINFEEFIQGVRDPLNERRVGIVLLAFQQLDTDGDGILEAGELMDKYDASKHPDVIAGRKTANQVLHEFLSTFDVGGVVDDAVTRDEFVNYYSNISPNIDNDAYFELMVRNAWHVSGGEGAAANSSNRRVLVTRPDGSQYVEEIRSDLGLRADDQSGMIARLRAQNAQVSQISLYGGVDTRTPATKDKPAGMTSSDRQRIDGRLRVAAHPAAHASKVVFGDDSGGPQKPKSLTGRRFSSTGGAQSGSSSRSVSDILAELKAQLATRGARGIVGMQRKFRIMDDDGSQAINIAEFKKAMRECALTLSDEDCQQLFNFFDADRSGEMDFEEFVQGLKGPLSPRRHNLIGLAFGKLDKDGDGIIEPEEVMNAFDASRHPDVLAGKRTAQEVLREFLDTFDVGGVLDGKVTYQEFENYYSNLGATIEDDDYFELMIRNAWHISGGEGWSANSANRRVLVTGADGSENVVELKNDLGLKAGDKAGMMNRLKAQGVSASSISLFDGGSDGVGADKKAQPARRSMDFVFGASSDAAGAPKAGRRNFHQTSQIQIM